jgi:hypothetical protein
MKVPAGTKCGQCDTAAAQLGVTSAVAKPIGLVLFFCFDCAEKLAEQLDLPSLREQLGRERARLVR